MILNSRFETRFQDFYQRNNKAKSKGKEGMKNFRCFPDHSSTGHVEKGFCGSTVSLLVNLKDNSPTIKAWAQFELADGSNRSCKLGDVILLKDVQHHLERTRFALARPWFPTIQIREDSEVVRFIVNSERWGWHYGWTSNVHTCDARHQLCVYFFETLQEGKLRCIDVVASPEFQIFCSRRRRTPSSPTTVAETEHNFPAMKKVCLDPKEEQGMKAATPTTLLKTNKTTLTKQTLRCVPADWKDISSEFTAASLLLFVRSAGDSKN